MCNVHVPVGFASVSKPPARYVILPACQISILGISKQTHEYNHMLRWINVEMLSCQKVFLDQEIQFACPMYDRLYKKSTADIT